MRRLIFTCLILGLSLSSFSQALTGVKTVGASGDYASLELAIAALNTNGVGTGGVTFNVSAGYTETLTAPLVVNATGTLANPIVFQKSGVGANPLITAFVGTAISSDSLPDGIFVIVGGDYITIDGIDLLDTNTTNPETMEYGYGLFKEGAENGCQYVTIKNCNITLSRENFASGSGPMVEGSVGILAVNSTPTAAKVNLVPTSSAGSNSFNKFYSNTIQNVNYGIVLYSYNATVGTGPNPDPLTFLGDMDNDIGGTSLLQGNTILNFGGGTAATNPSAGIRITYQSSANISYNTINNNNGAGVDHPNTLRGIYAQASVGASVNMTHNAFTIRGGGTTHQVAAIENLIGASGVLNTVNILNNTLDLEYLSATSGVCYGFWNNSSATADTVNMSGNTVTSWNYSFDDLTGTGANYIIMNQAAAKNVNVLNNSITNASRSGTIGSNFIPIYLSAGVNQNVSNNTIEDISVNTTAGTASTFYGIQVSGTTVVVNNNTINNLSQNKATGTSAFYGINNSGSSSNETYQNNTISNLTNLGSGVTYGMYFSTAVGTRTVSGNHMFNISSAGLKVSGMVSMSSSPSIYKNTIYNIKSSNIGAVLATGITVSAIGAAGYACVYNNFISDIGAPHASGTTDNVRGLDLSAVTANTSFKAYYNTVYLDASSDGANFSSAGIYHTRNGTPTTSTLDMRNNIIVNNSVANGSGVVTVFRRNSGVDLANISNDCNNNNFYSATGLLFYDGTNADTTLAAFKSRFAPRETRSINELPPFVNITLSPYNLHLASGTPTQCEGGGQQIVGITDDLDGNPRAGEAGYTGTSGGAPDLGAHEGNFTILDLFPPIISYTSLINTGYTTARTLTASIMDGSGVPTSGLGLPVLYWAVNAGAYTAATATHISGNEYAFSFGAGVTGGDSVSYYVAAQDVAAVPNIGVSPDADAAGFSINPPAVTTAPSNPRYYRVLSTLAGVFHIGTGMGTDYTTLTAAVEDYNAKFLTGPVSFVLDDANYLTETLPIIINPTLGSSAVNSLTIKPNAAATVVLSGSSASSVLKINGAENIFIDGSNNGTTSRDLTFENTNTAANTAAIWISSPGLAQGAKNVEVKNCVIKAGAITGTTRGVNISGASMTIGGSNLSDITIENNSIQKAFYGIYADGASLANIAENIQLKNNSIGSDSVDDYISAYGVYLTYVNNALVEGNDIFNIKYNGLKYGIYCATTTNNTVISRNKIHGFDQFNTGTFAANGIHLASGTSGITIQNNFIYDINIYGNINAYNRAGIRIIAGTDIKVYHNTIHLSGTYANTAANLQSACLFIGTATTDLDIRNNVFSNVSIGTTPVNYAVYTIKTHINPVSDYNVYYTTGNSIGFNAAAVANFDNWKTSTGWDANTFFVDPQFVADDDLHISSLTASSLESSASAISGVTNDFDGDVRPGPAGSLNGGGTAPDRGADEFDGILFPTATTAMTLDSICEGDSLQLSVDLTGTGPWSLGLTDGVTPFTVTGIASSPWTIWVSPTATTTYSVTDVSDIYGSNTSTASVIVEVNAVPVLVISDPSAVCSPSTVNITAVEITLGSTADLDYTYWTDVDATTAYTTPTTAANGAYFIKGTNLKGCFDIAQVNVLVNTTPTVVITDPAAVCSPATLDITAAAVTDGSTAGLTYSYWTDLAATTAYATPSAAIAGTYYIKGTDASTCFDIQAVEVINHALPVVFAGTDKSIPYGTSTSISDATATGTGTLTYSWTPADSFVVASILNPITVNLFSLSSYTLEVTDGNSCVNSDDVAITVVGGPLSASLTSSTSTVCSGSPVVLTAWASGGSGVYSYAWSGLTQTDSAVIVNPIISTTYTVTVSDGYTQKTAEVVITVNDLPTGTTTIASVPICFGDSTQLSIDLTGTAPWTLYLREGANPLVMNGIAATPFTIWVKPTSSTLFVLDSLMDFNGCKNVSTASTQVNVNALPIITMAPLSAACIDASAMTLNNATPIGGTYSGAGVASGAFTASVAGVGSHYIKYTYTDANSCANADSVAVTVNALPVVGGSASVSTLCFGETTILTGSGASSYTWNNSATNGVAIVPPVGTTVYTVIGTDGSGCKNTATVSVSVNPLPIATATAVGATTFCAGGSVVLNANTGTGLTYQWKKDNVDIASATTASYTASVSGAYTVVVTDAVTLCTATSTAINVTANPLPIATATAAGATTFCAGGSVVLNANTGAGLTYQWKKDNVNITGATLASYTASLSGAYTVVVTDAVTLCAATSTAVNVTVNSLPIATATAVGATTFCAGGSVVLNANTGTGITYQWKKDNVNITSATTASYTASTSGAYTVVVTNTATSCSATSTAVNVVANPLPIATATAAGATTFCDGGSVVFNANTGVGLTYQWKKDNVNITSATTASYTASVSGAYAVVVTASATSCYATSTAVNVTVKPLPIATATAVGATTFCDGGSVVLNANTGTGLTYQWKKDNVNITSATTASYTASTSGAYTVVVTSTATSCYATSTAVNVTSNSLPIATVTAAGVTTFCDGGSVLINAALASGMNYQWRKDGVNISGATTNTYTATATGTYKVVVTNSVTSCVDSSAAVVVTVNPLPVVTLAAINAVCIDLPAFALSGGLPANGVYSGTGVTAGTFDPSVAGAGSHIITYVYTDGNTCSSSAQQSIIVHALPIADAGSDVFLCNGDTATLTATGGTSYTWSSGSTIAVASVNPTITTTYYVTVNDGNCDAIDSVTVTVHHVLFSLGNDTVATSGSIILDAGAGFYTYLWSNGSTSRFATIDTVGVGLGIATVWCEVTDVTGCSASDEMLVDFTTIGQSKTISGSYMLKVYPNPSSDVFNVAMSGFESSTMKACVLNLQGQLIFCEDWKLDTGSDLKQINLGHMPRGVYFIRLTSEKQTITERIIVR